ncbi:uncharacterized protein LOC144381645 [Halichoerus grypus]
MANEGNSTEEFGEEQSGLVVKEEHLRNYFTKGENIGFWIPLMSTRTTTMKNTSSEGNHVMSSPMENPSSKELKPSDKPLGWKTECAHNLTLTMRMKRSPQGIVKQ